MKKYNIHERKPEEIQMLQLLNDPNYFLLGETTKVVCALISRKDMTPEEIADAIYKIYEGFRSTEEKPGTLDDIDLPKTH